nr:hypothetical protein [Entomoneis sp.]
MIKQNNYYQLQKMKHFFYQLQAGLYVTSFTDEYFQSLVIIPQVRFYKCPKQKFLIAKVWLVEELFNYAYPFALPDIFQQKLTKYQFQVRVKFLQAYVSPSIQKEIFIKDFFSSYPSALTNQTKTIIKKDFIQLVKLLIRFD